MATVEITISLPKELWEEAEEFGLLTSTQVTALLRNEVDRRVMELVNTEIQAYRAEKRAKNLPNTSDDPRRS